MQYVNLLVSNPTIQAAAYFVVSFLILLWGIRKLRSMMQEHDHEGMALGSVLVTIQVLIVCWKAIVLVQALFIER